MPMVLSVFIECLVRFLFIYPNPRLRLSNSWWWLLALINIFNVNELASAKVTKTKTGSGTYFAIRTWLNHNSTCPKWIQVVCQRTQNDHLYNSQVINFSMLWVWQAHLKFKYSFDSMFNYIKYARNKDCSKVSTFTHHSSISFVFTSIAMTGEISNGW